MASQNNLGSIESDNDPIFGISGIFEDYSPPSYEPFQNPLYLELNYDRFLWMLLWIMNFRTRFNIAKTTTETLIKFMKLALYEFSSDNFNDFPDSLYLTRKKLELNDQFHIHRSRFCNMALSEKISVLTNRTIIQPNLMYPFTGINQQLATMFCQPGFENSL
ncbi:hypothetical protein RhiirB3_458176 [Rhizophagus irregularis]|nr:hypothetical protein RhiirB3_458176 [Rhizophagus irregularis]